MATKVIAIAFYDNAYVVLKSKCWT